jgi:diacylglycerol kinase family enzyme
MYFLTVTASSKLSLLPHIWKLYKGNILDYRGAGMGFCRSVEIDNCLNGEVEFDGDHRGSMPVEIGVVKEGLEVMMDA